MVSLLAQLSELKQRFDEVSDLIIQPNIISDRKRYAQLNKQYKELKKIIPVYMLYKEKLSVLEEAEQLISENSDSEMVEMAKMEREEIKAVLPQIEEEIRLLLIPKDPQDEKNVILELRAGTGGDEACIFVEDIFRMYTLYFKERGWKYEVIHTTEGSTKGYKEMILEVQGSAVYGTMKFESGVHRVQRIPETESQGRVHTSAITVAVLPEAEEIDVEINLSEVRRDTFRSSGAGGQHVNKTESAIRLTHLPTGIVAECQDGRSQHKNYEKALQVLRTRIYQTVLEKAQKERAAQRKSLVSSGDRSAKIRTYNYPQGRVTDHRINKSIYNLPYYMNGSCQEMIDALKVYENAQKLKAQEEAV